MTPSTVLETLYLGTSACLGSKSVMCVQFGFEVAYEVIV